MEILELAHLYNLEDISELAECKNIKALYIYNSKKIDNLNETLSKMTQLEELVINEVGNIENIRFLDNMPNLVTFGFRNRLGLIFVNVASIICLISVITPYKGGRFWI